MDNGSCTASWTEYGIIMATVKTTQKGKYDFQRSNAAPKSVIVRPKGPPTAGSFGNKSTRTRYFSTSTGSQISGTGRRVGGGRTSSLAKSIGKGPTPQTKAIGAAAAAKGKVHLPHSDKRTASGFGKAVNHSPVLVAEFLAALILVGFQGMSGIAKNGYQHAISGILLRFSAITAIWFVLFLFASSKRGGTFASWFGFLIVLAILFDAVNKGSIKDLTGIVSGAGIKEDPKLLSENLKAPEYYATPQAGEAQLA